MPWPNQAFFYAIVALDEQGNRSPVSNLIAVYIAEVTTTTTTMSPLAAYPDISPAELLSYLQRQHNHQLDGANETALAANPLLREQLLLRGLTENLVDLKANSGGGGSSSEGPSRGTSGYAGAAGSGMWSMPVASAAAVVVDVGLGAHLDHR